MRQDMLKRVGMLAASAAVCSAVAAGGLMMQGMRYVRPTAENWSLLPYAEPAAKVEQTVGWSSKGEEFSRDYVFLTGYDEQGREIWKKSRFSTDPALRSEHWTYDGDTVTWHTITNGIKGDTYLQYDAQGRMVRQEAGDIITVYSYRGDETKQYLTEAHSVEGVLRSRGTAEIDPETGDGKYHGLRRKRKRNVQYGGRDERTRSHGEHGRRPLGVDIRRCRAYRDLHAS